jgi:FdrA protein
MSHARVTTRPGAYADSVRLMQVSQLIGSADGVEAALVAMATDLNLDLAREMGFTVSDATADDLLIAVRATDATALDAAIELAEQRLAARPHPQEPGGADGVPARTVRSVVRQVGPALALISVPGPHAFTEAMDALDAGCDVLVFSDNVPVEHEVRMKEIAAQRDLLVMGPDCGTALVGGIGLGFANVVQPGPVGLVAASGTGAQQMMCLLDAADIGVSAVLGVGGRDLSADIAGRGTIAALDALDADPATELIVVLSKPPDPSVAERVRARTRTAATPVLFALVGPGYPDLTAAAEDVVRALGFQTPRWPEWPGRVPAPARGPASAPGALRGLFSGGTLCVEAMVIASQRLGRVASNIPLPGERHVDATTPTTGHVMVDFGDDALTRGRPHPMIDPSLRLSRLEIEAADPAVGVILLDVVLGHAAHHDPAAEVAPVVGSALAARPELTVVVSLVGSRRDPQDLNRQASMLHRAGAHVFTSNAHAARFATSIVTREPAR